MGTQLRHRRQGLLLYIAANEDLILEHAQRGEFPANRISEFASIIDPTTAT